jgi:hypothetical protein
MNNNLTFNQKCYLKEVNIRGICMTMSADMESILLKIILYCIVDDPNATIRKFEEMTLGQKLNMAKLDLKKYHLPQFKKYLTEFKQMEKFVKLRGKLAHCQIEWDESEKDDSWFQYIDIKKVKGDYRMIKVKLSVKEVQNKFDVFRINILKMSYVADEMIKNFNYKYPNFFSSSNA